MEPRSDPETIGLLVVDDSAAVRSGLASLLASTEIQIMSEASDGNEAVHLASQHSFDVILLDYRMPHCDGLTALPRLKQVAPDVPVLMLSSHTDERLVRRAIMLGAHGYLLKGDRPSGLIDAIREAAHCCRQMDHRVRE